MFLHELAIKNFRCFDVKKFNFQKQVTLITGDNGVGKTSIAEAIHYLCYVKSFRCNLASDLVSHGDSSFFLKGSFTPKDCDQLDSQLIQVGYANKKKSIKLNGKSVITYKDIFQVFQVVTLLEDDIELVKGNPSGRRSFIDQAALFLYPEYLEKYKLFKKILQNRNALLQGQLIDDLELEVWTQKLWQASIDIQKYRKEVLLKVSTVANDLLKTYFQSVYNLSIEYNAKHLSTDDETFDLFVKKKSFLLRQEKLQKRSGFGAHLDDFTIYIKNKNARLYASRGQQKLISLLCKLSLISIAEQNDYLPILIIDDFIADFDKKRLINIIDFFLKCKNQIIITTPIYDSNLKEIIEKADPDVISIEY